MEVINIVEKMIRDNIDEVLEAKPGACKCEKCRADILAYTLNHLQPRYVATNKGEMIAKSEFLDQQYRMRIIVALTTAVEQVFAHPHHDKE